MCSPLLRLPFLALVLMGGSVSATERVFTPEGLPTREDFFPIAVWLQSPHNAARFQAAGINLYVGLWEGPNQEQLDALAKVGMPVICDQNEFAKTQLKNPLIAAWMHGDEPDNAQAKPEAEGGGYGPPILPTVIQGGYEQLRQADPGRPVLLNLGQGVAWDGWYGRGERTRHPEDYLEYIKGCDIASFDIYPAVHDHADVAGKLEFVGNGTSRLKSWANPRPVWACIEASRIGNVAVKPTPAQIRSEVWMAIINGAHGLIYFVHQFEPEFKEASLLDDQELLAAVTGINAQVRELAPVLNSPDVPWPDSTEKPAIQILRKRHRGYYYLFSVNMTNSKLASTFVVPELAKPGAVVEELGTNAKTPLDGISFSFDFEPYGVRLLRIKE